MNKKLLKNIVDVKTNDENAKTEVLEEVQEPQE